ncbi:MAG: S8 family serine peptidase [Bdellovibrionales bacterium]|nr:S8 family serine peptidase [Bdellovibrionales bacterium]
MKNALVVSVVVASFSIFSSCSKSQESFIPELTGSEVRESDVPVGKSVTAKLNNGTEITVHNIGGKLFHPVESVLDDRSMADIGAIQSSLTQSASESYLAGEIGKISSKLSKAGAIQVAASNKVGYFSFYLPYESGSLMSALKSVDFGSNRRLIVNPVVVEKGRIKELHAYGPQAEAMTLSPAFRKDTENFSGLVRMGVPTFVKDAEKEIGNGQKVNGSSVRLGITDTGITYNHPTFMDRTDSKNRIIYMRDFTKEGRVYFRQSSKFHLTPASDPADLAKGLASLSAEYIATPKLPNIPQVEKPKTLTDIKVFLPQDLLNKLASGTVDARYGLLLEESLDADSDPVDINNNGKQDDALPIILVVGATPKDDLIYFDPSGTNDFRNVTAVRNFNTSGDTVSVYSEKIGFDVREDKLPSEDGKTTIAVRSVSIVGYDPGNHGSHVAGIAAGRKTLADNSDDTLARGPAPEAQILMNRVCANNTGCSSTAALIDLAVEGQAEVINMSLGGLSAFNDGYGVEETVINRLTSVENVLFVISAGNSGPGRQTVGSPSTARHSLSVGASASRGLIQRQYQWPGSGSSSILTGQGLEDDFMLFFSSRGPSAAGGFKPMISAPGTELSSIQLNAAPGARAGLDVYWGTSMAAPSATGAYALFVDAIKKYNAANPGRELSTDAITLRNVLIESARPFDTNSFNPETGERSLGQYTWIDQGTGMIDLPKAWKTLFALRDSKATSSVALKGKSLDPDYQVFVSEASNPSGQTYDGSRTAASKAPAFGTGLYLKFTGTETLKQVHIARQVPQAYVSTSDAGAVSRSIATTHDEFVLKTVIQGSNKVWLKAGVLDQLNCMSSQAENLTIIGRGVEVKPTASGGTLTSLGASTLNICLDRQMIANDLPAGDNAALIYAYRTKNGQVSPVASFVVPVYVTVPHKTLTASTAYDVKSEVASFGVNRNYVTIPKGTTIARVTLTVPAVKRDSSGLVAAGETCQGVELMSLEAGNTAKSLDTRAAARVSNCDATGVPYKDTDARRTLTITRANPKAGSWDLHVFGQYKYLKSNFNLRVDYVIASGSIDKIEGQASALVGNFHWAIQESSLAIAPSEAKSVFQLNGFKSKTSAKVAEGKTEKVVGSDGSIYRKYDLAVKKVEIRTGESDGNDIDLRVLGCDGALVAPDLDSCETVGSSGGSDDNERVVFLPEAGRSYVVLVDGYSISGDGSFVASEVQTVSGEKGSIKVSGAAPDFTIAYDLSGAAQGSILTHAGFTSKLFQAVGELTLKSDDGVTLDSIPVTISAP